MKLVYRWMIIVCMLFVCGCAGSSRQQAAVEPASVQKIQQMTEEQRSFAVVLTQSMCSACRDVRSMLSAWKEKRSGIIYMVTLDEAVTDREKELLQQLFPDFYAPPGVYYMRKGAASSRFWSSDYKTCEDDFAAWLQLQEKQAS